MRVMTRLLMVGALVASGCSGVGPSSDASMPKAEEIRGLKNAASFAGMTDNASRAQALFTEAGKVFTHARCVNCHPTGERPLQTDAMALHEPPVVRGKDGHGVAGLHCATCHATENAELVGVAIPGHPAWHLAPASMGWQDMSVAGICAQIKDKARNGNKTIAEIVHHVTHDSLVGWGWNPGPGREPAPGTQAVFGELVQAWAAAGAHCPPDTGKMASK